MKNHIKYFMSGGTLIGAVRHKGFIPWDDDIDIMMLRPDYENFVKSYPHGGRYNVLAPEVNPNFPFPFAKVEDTATVLEENMAQKWPMGVNVDVFPIEKVPEDDNARERIYRKARLIYNIYSVKKSNFPRHGWFFRALVKVLHFILLLVPIRTLNSWSISNAKKYADKETILCGAVVWGYGEKEVHPISDLAESIDMQFEDKVFQGPIGYDSYLRALFGDYMKLPPKEKQVSHHDFSAYMK